MLKLMLISSDPDIARYAIKSGVNRIFVDLEILGKKERQGHLDTVMSQHSFDDVQKVRDAIGSSELLVRINPLHEHTHWEVETAIACGANLIMLPMCNSPHEVWQFCEFVAGRAKTIPLIETPQSFTRIREILKIANPDEVYLGLNDLHLALRLDFMFEPLSAGLVDYFAQAAIAYDTPFGFGGMACLGNEPLPAELILAEHVRLCSSSVILSRSFHGKAQSLPQMQRHIDLALEIEKIRAAEQNLQHRNSCQQHVDRLALVECVRKIVSKRINPLPAQFPNLGPSRS